MCACVCAKEMLLKVLQSIALKVEFPQVESNAVQCSILWKLLHCAIRIERHAKKYPVQCNVLSDMVQHSALNVE